MTVVHDAAHSTYVQNYSGSEDLLLYRPRNGSVVGRIPVIYAHGFGGGSGSLAYKNIIQAEDDLRPIAALGYPVAVPDLGGTTTWGSDPSWTAVGDTVTWMGTNLGTRTDLVGLAGESMGALTVLNYAWRFPTKPAVIWLRVPVVNLANFKTRNQATFGGAIESAYGGLAAYTAALPTHDPSHVNNWPVLAPFRNRAHVWHTQSDEFVDPLEVSTFCNLTGWPATIYPGDHAAGFNSPPYETAEFVVNALNRYL